MTLIAVLIVAAAEFYFQWGAHYRQFNWFDSIKAQLMSWFSETEFFSGMGGVMIILLSPLAVLAFLLFLVPSFLYELVLFSLSVAILFLCMGPKPLKLSFDRYFEAIERGDEESAFHILQEETNIREFPESEELARNATRAILLESQSRYFGVLFWFVFLGPFGALFYRLSHLYHNQCGQSESNHLQYTHQIIHVIDWLPARLTSLLFLLTGDFVNGFYRIRDYLSDFSADNQHLITETGVAALGYDMRSSAKEFKENHDALNMVRRTLIIFLVVVAALTPVSFW